MPEEEPNINETIDWILRVLVRRRWWIVLPACLTALAGIGVLLWLPNRYTSEATLVVVEQQISERYVVPNVTTEFSSTLEAMKQEVLSRGRLLEMIERFNLYPKERQRLAPEELLALMLSHLEIVPLSGGTPRNDFNSFKISFTAQDPRQANQVTGTLTSLFIQKNLESREQHSANTTEFLEEQLETAEKALAEQEERLRDFKMSHLGELPEQQAGNLSILAGLQNQLQNAMASLSRAQERRVYLESLLSGYRSLAARNAELTGLSAGSAPVPSVGRPVSPIQAARAELRRLEGEKEALLDRYSPLHPDVVRIEREVTRAEQELKRLEESIPSPESAEPEVSGAPVIENLPLVGSAEETLIAQTTSQLEANRIEIENLAEDEKKVRASIAEYQNRLNRTPVREQQLAAIRRDYDLLQKNYEELLAKQLQSQLATNLERSQAGQQFRLIDPPSLPVVPTSPKRLKLSLAAIAGGLFLGMALAFAVETRDRSFHTEKALSRRFSLPVLGMPLLLSPVEERRSSRKRIFEWAAGTVLTLAVLVAEFYVYRFG